MDPRLPPLIRDYQAAVIRAIALLESAGIERPSSALGWSLSSIRHEGALPGGGTYRKHGYGCAVEAPGLEVDFDFGEDGRIGGFDSWRLLSFGEDSGQAYGFSSDSEIDRALKNAAKAGELVYSGYLLYFLPP